MRRPLLIIVAAAALLTAACGDDTDSAGEAASEIEQTAGEAASDAQSTASEVASEAEDAASEVASEAEETASEAASEAEAATGAEVDEEAIAQQADDVVAQLRDRGLTNVASFIDAVGLENVVQDTSFTLLAPSDDAFLELDREVLTGLLSDPAEGVRILQDHLLDDRIDAAQLAGMSEVTTSSGSTLTVVANGSDLVIGGATVTEADIDAGGGVVHVVDAVITTGS